MSPDAPRVTIGGDFELDSITYGDLEKLTLLDHGLDGSWTMSGRSALWLVLRHLIERGVSHVHLPAYLCESVLQPVEALGLNYSFYGVDRSLVAHPQPPAGSVVVVINYFGWLNPGLNELRNEPFVIEDSCQAILSDWQTSNLQSRYIVLSPRKFGPTAVGGWCNVPGVNLPSTTSAEMAIDASLKARLLRGEYLRHPESSIDIEIEKTYLTALESVEHYLDANPTQSGIPEASLKVIAAIDWEFVSNKRRDNWLKLKELLSEQVEPVFQTLPDSVVPLGFAVRLPNRDRVRAQLAQHRIFCPVHWPLPKQIDRSEFPVSAELSDTLMTLPIDQRYGDEDMIRLAKVVREVVQEKI
jgi:hypothetical protein